MNHKGIYLWYKRINQKSPSGQIAAVLTIIIAIIFLFIAITINIGKISKIKTSATIAADGGGLVLASTLASMGHLLSENYLEGKTHDCDFNPWCIVGIALIVAGVILVICGVEWGAYLIKGGVASLARTNLVIYPEAAVTFNRNMSKMTAEIAAQEGAIQYALFATVDDPEIVTDYNDYDEDGRTDDKIPRFFAWYAWRGYWLAEKTDTLKAAVKDLKEELAYFTGICRKMRFYIADIKKWPDPPEGVFITLLQDIDGKENEPECEKGIVYDFIPQESWTDYGGDPKDVIELQLKKADEKTKDDNVWYDFTFWTDGTNPDDESDSVNDDVDFFYKTLCDFHQWVKGDYECHRERGEQVCEGEKGFLQMSSDELARTASLWFPELKTWIEDTFYSWEKAEGPLEHWRAGLVNDTLVNKIDKAIEKLEKQLKNDDVPQLYFGGLKNIDQSGLNNDEKAHLAGLIEALEDSIEELKDIGWEERSNEDTGQKNIHYAESLVADWQDCYKTFCDEWDKFKGIYEMIKHPGYAEYEWKDSLGEHKVRVDVAIRPSLPRDYDTLIPTVKSYTRTLGFETCYDLKNYKGVARVTVSRKDSQEEDINLGKRLLWTFRPSTVTSTAKVHYDITPDGIYIMR